MKKLLRNLFLLVSCFIATSVNAQIEFAPGDFTTAESAATSSSKNGVSIAITSGTITTEEIRIFKSQTITFSSDKSIEKIEFTCKANGSAKYGPGCFGEVTPTGYSFESSGNVGTWTGSATSVSFKATENQVRATKIVVTLGDGGTGSTKSTATAQISGTTVTVGETLTASITEGYDGNFTIATSDESIARVDGLTVYGVAEGSATITATWTETENYNSGSKEFSITVKEAQAPITVEDGVFNFTQNETYGQDLTPSDKSTNESTERTWTAGNVKLVTAGAYRYWYNANGNTLRIYSNGSIKLSVPEGKVITKVAFTGSDYKTATVSVGAFNSNGDWEGSAQEVKFTRNDKNIQYKTITVTYTDDDGTTPVTVAVPGVAVDKTEAAEGESVVVSFTHPNLTAGEETTIYYTIDGTEPTTESSKIVTDDTESAIVTLTMGTQNLVIVAKAEVGGELSAASAAKTVTYKAAAADDDVVVTLPYENTLLGTTIPENFTTSGDANVWTYTSNYGVKATAGSKVDKEAYLITPLVDMTHASAPKMKFSHTGRYFGTPANEATLWAREKGGAWQQVTIPTYFSNSNWTYVDAEIDLSAFAGKTVQFGFRYTSSTSAFGTWEIKNLSIADGEIVVTYQDETIESLNEKTSASIDNINLKLNNAQVVYVDATQGAYVREGNYAIQFFKTGLSLTVGQTLTGSIKFNYSPYYGLPEVKDIDGVTTLDDVTVGTVETPEPTEVTLEEMQGLVQLADLVKVSNVTIEVEQPSTAPEGLQAAASATYYAVSGSVKIQLYDKFGTNLLTESLDGQEVEIEGIIGAIYNGNPQLFPTKITTTATAISNIENDATATQQGIYNLAGQRVDNNYRGIVIINGKKILKK